MENNFLAIFWRIRICKVKWPISVSPQDYYAPFGKYCMSTYVNYYQFIWKICGW